MPAIGIQPVVLNDVLLRIGANDYEAHVSQVTFTPTAPTVRWRGMTPTSNHVFGGIADWTVSLDFAQDFETADSLALHLLDNEATKEAWTFEPKKGGSSFASTVVLTPGGIGGAVDTVAASSVTLGCTKPVRTPAA
jgi:hypothetical protein